MTTRIHPALVSLVIGALSIGQSLLNAADPPPLWASDSTLPSAADLPVLNGVRFSVVKPYEPDRDGYRFLHGVALCFHNGRLYASFGHNLGSENTETEQARWCVSDDDGRSWSEVRTMDSGDDSRIGVSHGVFLSHSGRLWAFQGAYSGSLEHVHTRAYLLDESKMVWQPQGTVIGEGFWPMQEPVRMQNGNWIIAGLRVGDGNPAVVAISHGDDLRHWDVIPVPLAEPLEMWGESTILVDGPRVTNISRFGAEAVALVAHSSDYGRTWSPMQRSNLPMVTSKPYAGTLSTGQRYLIATTTADSGKRRSPLTIAVSQSGNAAFSRVFVIRHAEFPNGPGESHPRANLAYPYAVEQDGHLYVGYSNNGGNVGRKGQGRELANNNSAELAVIPISSLHVE